MISIIDNDESVRESIKVLVQSLGYDVEAFGSAAEFLTSGQVRSTTCLITDVEIPGLIGVDQLMTNGDRVPVTLMSQFRSRGVQARIAESGSIGFLNQTFDEDCLIGYLARALNGARSGMRS
jgi:FixJ family two-component response regulator